MDTGWPRAIASQANKSRKKSDEFLFLWRLERQRQLIGKFSDFFNG